MKRFVPALIRKRNPRTSASSWCIVASRLRPPTNRRHRSCASIRRCHLLLQQWELLISNLHLQHESEALHAQSSEVERPPLQYQKASPVEEVDLVILYTDPSSTPFWLSGLGASSVARRRPAALCFCFKSSIICLGCDTPEPALWIRPPLGWAVPE